MAMKIVGMLQALAAEVATAKADNNAAQPATVPVQQARAATQFDQYR